MFLSKFSIKKRFLKNGDTFLEMNALRLVLKSVIRSAKILLIWGFTGVAPILLKEIMSLSATLVENPLNMYGVAIIKNNDGK